MKRDQREKMAKKIAEDSHRQEHKRKTYRQLICCEFDCFYRRWDTWRIDNWLTAETPNTKGQKPTKF